MNNKGIAAIVILLLVILSAVIIHSFYHSDGDDRADLALFAGANSLSVLTDEVKTNPYYEGYNNETLSWMESLGDKLVFSGDGILVIMGSNDAGKLHTEDITDADMIQYIECDVVENHSLITSGYSTDVLLVDNVELIDVETCYYDV